MNVWQPACFQQNVIEGFAGQDEGQDDAPVSSSPPGKQRGAQAVTDQFAAQNRHLRRRFAAV